MHGLIPLKDRVVELGEEFAVQRGNRGTEVEFGDDEAQVQQRCALRDHADVDALERVEYAARHARSIPDIVAHQTDDGLIFFDFDVGELAQLGLNLFETLEVVDGERNADLRSGDHVDRSFEAVEDLKDAMQEAMRHEHARGVNIDDRDLAFAGDGFDGIGAVDGLGNDARAGDLGAARVENQHRNVFFDGWYDGCGVQYLGAEVGQLGGFGEGDGLDAVAAGQNRRVGGEHAVDVGPDLD